MIKYSTLNINEDNLEENALQIDELIKLSKLWEQEHSMPSYTANEKDFYIDKDIFLAYDNGKLVGYILGNKSVQTESTSYNKIGEIAFKVEEFYVLKEYRNNGIGKNLYGFMERTLKNKVDFIGLIAVSRDYKSLMRFYEEELDMDFKYALLVKRLK